METIRSFLKLIFLPSFVYEYSFRDAPQFIEKAVKRLGDLGGERVLTRGGESSCHLPSGSVFGRLSSGRLAITLLTPSADEVRCRVLFLTHRFSFYLIAGLLSSAIVVRSIYAWSATTLLVLPVIFLSGHLYFWGVLPAKVGRLKTFLRQLGD